MFATAGWWVCGDVFFSGHAGVVAIMASVWSTYDRGRASVLVWMLLWLEAVFMLADRYHYSIDIIIGIFVARQLWVSYHRMSPFFRWMESAPAIVKLQREQHGDPEELLEWLKRAPPVRDLAEFMTPRAAKKAAAADKSQ